MHNLPVHRTFTLGFVIGCVLFVTMSGSLVAQTTGAVNPNAAADPSGKDGAPAGDCMPIGITVSGDVVFPFQCRDFIERLKAADRKAAGSGEKHSNASGKPTVEPGVPEEDKAAANNKESVAPEDGKPAERPAATTPLENRTEDKPREQNATSEEKHTDAPGPTVEPAVTAEKAAANKEEGLAPENSKSAERPVAPLENRIEDKPREQADSSGENRSDASAKPTAEPAITEDKAAADKEAADKEESVASVNNKPVERPAAKAPREYRTEHKSREQAAGPPGCTRFRTYDSATGTYRSYDGRRLACRVVDRAALTK